MNTATLHPPHILARVEIPDPESEEIRALAENDPATYAAKNLGYAHPKHAKAKSSMSKLARELRSAGVKPFDPNSVERYKKKKAKIPCFGRLFEAVVTPVSIIAFFAAAGAILLNSAILGCAKIFAVEWLANAAWGTQPFFVCSALLFWLLVVAVAFSSKKVKVLKGEWSRTGIEGYKEEVPLFALETMQEIHMRCPEAQFWVEEMHVESRLCDPFLGVTDPETREVYYLEVWDEPSFNETRVV